MPSPIHIHDIKLSPQIVYGEDFLDFAVIYEGHGQALHPDLQSDVFRNIAPQLLRNGIPSPRTIHYIPIHANTAAFNSRSTVHVSTIWPSLTQELTLPQLEHTISESPPADATARPDTTYEFTCLPHEDQIAYLLDTGMSSEQVRQLNELYHQWLSDTEQDRLDSLAHEFTSENRNPSDLFQEWMNDWTVIGLAQSLGQVSLSDYRLAAAYMMSRALARCISAHLMASAMRQPVPLIGPEDESAQYTLPVGTPHLSYGTHNDWAP